MTDNTWPTVDTELIDDVTLYSAKLIIPVTGPVIIDGAVAIHGDRVVHVGKRRWVLKALKQEMTAHGTIHERHWDGVLTPGLINAHTHLQYSGMVQADAVENVPVILPKLFQVRIAEAAVIAGLSARTQHRLTDVVQQTAEADAHAFFSQRVSRSFFVSCPLSGM